MSVEVLGPASDSGASREEDRGLVLLFRANDGALLWGGRLDAAGQAELAQAFPGLHADVLALSGDAAPRADWLGRIGTRFWLQLPARQRDLNASMPRVPEAAPCAVWPLQTTGAVMVHFRGGAPPGVELTPWVTPP